MGQAPFQYKSVAELESGQHGTLAVGQGSGRVVLLRRLTESRAWSGVKLDALAEVSRRARGVHHPTLLSVVDVERSADAVVVATEYVEGVPLSALMSRARAKRRPISVGAAVRIAKELARAIVAAEQLSRGQGGRWVFPGLHPECVLISSGDDALISDLGLVALEGAVTSPGLVAYRAPESDSSGDLPGAPVFSIGLLLWEMLAGTEAFEQTSPSTSVDVVRQKVLTGGVPRLERLVRGVPSLLVEIVMQSLRADPSARFPNTSAFAEALGAVPHEPSPGLLERMLNDLATDLLERQRGAIARGSVPIPSGRPTLHTIDASAISIPRAPKLIGLAAFQPPVTEGAEPGADSGRAVDALLDQELPASSETFRVEIPVSAGQPSARGPQATLPLLLVEKAEADAPAAAQARAPGTLTSTPSVSLDDLDYPPPRRRLGAAIVVSLGLLGAGAVGVLAVMKQSEGDGDTSAAAPASSASAAGDEESLPDPAESEDAGGEQATRRQPKFHTAPQSRKDKRDAAVETGSTATEAPSAPTQPPASKDNPYADPPTAPPASSANEILGY